MKENELWIGILILAVLCLVMILVEANTAIHLETLEKQAVTRGYGLFTNDGDFKWRDEK